MYESMKADTVSKMGAIEAAEAMAAAAVAEMAEMKAQLEQVKCNSRRMNSEHSKRAYRVKKDLLEAKRELRSERGVRRSKETDAFLLRREHGALLEQRNALDQQIHEIEDIWAHQRAYLVQQVSTLRTTAAEKSHPSQPCNHSEPKVVAGTGDIKPRIRTAVNQCVPTPPTPLTFGRPLPRR